MSSVETRPRAPSPPRTNTLNALAIPGVTLVFALAWYVAVQAAHADLIAVKEGQPIELARAVMTKRREAERKRLENDCGIVAYDPRLGTMLKQDLEPELIGQLARSLASLLPGTGVAVLSTEGKLIASTISGLDEATIRSSSVVDRAKQVTPPQTEDLTNLARLGVWIIRSEPRRVLDVCVSSIHLGEPMGMVALTSPIEDLLHDVRALTGVHGAIFVGSELFHAGAEMRETFASLRDVVPGPATRVRRGDRELMVQVDEIEASGLGIRMMWIDAHPLEKKSAAFGLLLWVPIAGALLLGVRAGLLYDRTSRARASA